MIQIQADTRRAVVTNKELLTTGSAGIEVQFTLSEDWNGLVKLAVFRVGDDWKSEDIVLDSSRKCVVPAEALVTEHAEEVLFIGIYGSNGNGTIIIPTIWASAGAIRPGTTPNNPSEPAPTPSLIEQLLRIAQDAEITADDAYTMAENAQGYIVEKNVTDAVELFLTETVPNAIGQVEAEGDTQIERINQAVEDVQEAIDQANEDAAEIISDLREGIDTLEEEEETIVQRINSALDQGTDDTLSQQGWPADAKATGDAIGDLNNALEPFFETEISRNIFTPISTRIYPESGTCTIGDDKKINITNVPNGSSVRVFAQGDSAITLSAGNYVLCFDPGLYVYGSNSVRLQVKIGTNSYTDIVVADNEQTPFTIENDITGLFRIAYYASATGYTTTWSGHMWICAGEAQEYMPVGEIVTQAKEFVTKEQGAENSGKILSVGNDGNVTLISNLSDDAVLSEIYLRGNLLDYSGITGGYIKSDGTVQPYNSLWCSDFCEVEPGVLYTYEVYPTQYFAFYAGDKTVVATYSTLGALTKLSSNSVIYKIDVPENAKYFRCTFGYNQAELKTAWISNSPETPSFENVYNVKDVDPYTFNPKNPCDYAELTVRAFSKVVCIGDSLTYGGFNLSDSGSPTGETQSSAELSTRYSYPSNFERITGIETVNAGDSGETSVSWYQAHQNDDFSSYDLAVIFLGVNDSAFQVSDADTLTAMQNIVTMLNNARSDMRIAICSCIPAYDSSGYQAKGQLILNWAKSLNDSNIIPLDLAQYSHVKPRTSYVAGHCSALGYYMMALDIARYISWYMDQHKRDFRFIQFIGSPDAEWSGD